MRLFYLVSAIIVFLILLVVSLPQMGTTAAWITPLSPSTSPTLALFGTAGLGVLIGGLLVLFWKAPKEGGTENTDSEAEE